MKDAELLSTEIGLSKSDTSRKEGDSPKQVGLRFTLDNITDISTSNQSFRAIFRMVFRWVADEKDEKTYDADNASWEPKWKPKLAFKNAIDQPDVSVKPGKDRFYYLVDHDNKKWVEYTFRCEGTFMEPFELKAFPFDCQDLSIILELGNKGGIDKYVLTPDPSTTSFAKFNLGLCVLTEWILHPPMLEFGLSHPDSSKNSTVRPLFIAKLKMQRNYKFYLNRVCLFLALLSLLTLCSFANDVASVVDRLSLDFTLLLSLAAYQSVVGSYLPMLSFLTYIDLYMTAVILFVCGISIENAIIGYVASNVDNDDQLDTVHQIDDAFFYICVLVWFIFHLAFAIYLPILINKEVSKMSMDTKQLEQNRKSTSDDNLDTYFITNKMIDSSSLLNSSPKTKDWVSIISKTKSSGDPSDFFGDD